MRLAALTPEALGRVRRLGGAAFALAWLFAHARPAQAWPLAGQAVLVSFLALAVVALLVRFPQGLPQGRWQGAMGLWLAFAGWMAFRLAAAPVPHGGDYLFTQYAFAPLVFLLGLGAATTAERRQAAFAAFLLLLAALGVLFAIHGLAQYHWLYPMQYQTLKAAGALNLQIPLDEGVAYALQAKRVGSFFGNPNLLACLLAMAMPAALALGFSPGHWRRRVLALLAVAVMALALWRTQSVGGMTVSIIGLGSIAMLLFLNKKGRLAAGLAGAALFLATGAGQTPPQSSDEARPLRTIEQRIFYLESAWSMVRDKPLLGHGPGAYAWLYPVHREAGAGEARYPHNFVAQLAVEGGLVGLGLFLALLGWVVYHQWRLWREGRFPLYRGALFLIWKLFLLDSLGEYSFSLEALFWDFAFITGLLMTPSQNKSGGPSLPRWGLSVAPLALAAILFFTVSLPLHQGAYDRYQAELWADSARNQSSLESALGDYRMSLAATNRALEHQPRHPRLLQSRAGLWEEINQPRQALKDLEAAMKVHPYSASLRSQRAGWEWRYGSREAALDWVEKAIALHPLKATLHAQKARYLAGLGQWDKALQVAEESVKMAVAPLELQECQAIRDRIVARGHGKDWE